MGVINITPNSFYGPSKYQDADEVYQKFVEWKTLCSVFDLGAQSTAPQSAPIDEAEELRRYGEIALPAIEKYYGEFKTLPLISIDTYRAHTFFQVCKLIRKIKHDASLVWNDVSGQFDESVLEVLLSNRNNSYVLCHNRVPNREATARHLSYALNQPQSIATELSHFFSKAEEVCYKHQLTERVYFDLNFGFAKSRQENHQLLNDMTDLMNSFPKHHWVIGLSQKSFLKLLESDDKSHYREHLHFYLLAKLKKNISLQNLTVRAHDPYLVQLVNCTSESLNI